MGQDVGKVLPLLGHCLGTPLAEPHAMAVAFCGKTERTAFIPDREAGAAQAQRLPQGRTGDALPADRQGSNITGGGVLRGAEPLLRGGKVSGEAQGSQLLCRLLCRKGQGVLSLSVT